MAAGKVISGAEKSGNGPIRAVITAQGRALAVLEQAEGRAGANAVIREALQAGGDLWVEVFLPQRFTEKARQLGYTVTPGWAARKQKLTGQSLPLVYTGAMRDHALANAHAQASAKKGGGVIRIRIPISHGSAKGGRQNAGLQPQHQAVLRRIPAYEIKRVAAQVERVLIAQLNLRGAHNLTAAPVMSDGRAVAHVPGRVA